MRRILVVVAALAVAACAGAAGAYFTGQAQVPDNLIQAGTVAVSTEPTAAALSVPSLAPGAVEWRPLTVVNDGNLPSDIVVTAAKKAGITDFYDALTCTVQDENGATIYSGSLAALRTTPVVLQPGTRRQLKFGVGLPAEAGNDLAGDYCKVTVYVDAAQVR